MEALACRRQLHYRLTDEVCRLKGPESRQKGSQLILERISDFADSTTPVALVGDLNSESTQEAYLILTGGMYSQGNGSAAMNANASPLTLLDTREEVITSANDDSQPYDDPSSLRGRFGEMDSNPGFPESHLTPKNIDYILYRDPGTEGKAWSGSFLVSITVHAPPFFIDKDHLE